MALLIHRSWFPLFIALMCTWSSASAFVPPAGVPRAPSPAIKDTVWSVSSPTATSSTVLFNGMWSSDDEIQGLDRFKACIPYILPLLDGDQFGKYIYMRIPPLGFANDVLLGPLLNIYHSIPFLGIALFIALTLGTRGATNMNKGVRFNAQQAALIDVALIFPELIANTADGQQIPRYVVEPCANFVWYTYIAMVGYSWWSNLNGKKPNEIPIISQAAEMAVGPF